MLMEALWPSNRLAAVTKRGGVARAPSSWNYAWGPNGPHPPLGNHDMAHLVDISSLRTAPRCHNKRRSAGATSYLVIPFGNDNRISRLPS